MTTEYNPAGLLDAVMAKHQLKNDRALADLLKVAPPVLSKVRGNKMLAGDSLVLRCVEIAGMTLPEVRQFVPSPYLGAQ